MFKEKNSIGVGNHQLKIGILSSVALIQEFLTTNLNLQTSPKSTVQMYSNWAAQTQP